VAKKKQKIEVGDLVYITWFDAVGENSGWMLEVDKESQLGGSLCKAAGFFIGTSDGLVHIAQLYRDADGSFSRVLSIPVGCIVKTLKMV